MVWAGCFCRSSGADSAAAGATVEVLMVEAVSAAVSVVSAAAWGADSVAAVPAAVGKN